MTDNPAIIAPGEQFNIPEILSVTNLFMLPSYREGLPISLMEAGAMGVPAVASDVIGCNEVVVDGETGVLIPPHSSSDIENAVEKLYIDKELYFSMTRKCREQVLSRFDSKKLLREYVDYYNSLVKMV